MKVLVLGSTGNVGSRLVPALLVNKHTPVLLVRSPEKLSAAITSAVSSDHIIVGSGSDSGTIKKALVDHDCDGVVNAAGLAGFFSKTEAFPAIVKAVATAAAEAGKERGRPLRAWFLGGFSVMDMPPELVGGRKEMLVDYIPVFPDHRVNYEFLQSFPVTALNWSMLGASGMSAAKPSNPVATATNDGLALAREAQAHSSNIIGSADTPPDWKPTLAWVPLVGGYLNAVVNAGRYLTTLEQATEFIVADLGKGLKSEFTGKRVAIIIKS